jgi:hypothetical protein
MAACLSRHDSQSWCDETVRSDTFREGLALRPIGRKAVISRIGALRVRSAWLVAVVAIGCVGAPAASQAPVSTQPASVPVPSLDATPTQIPSGPLTLIGCHDGQHCNVVPGSYLTGPIGFFPGLEITIPANWFLSDQDSGELSLRPNDHRDDALLLWKDVRVVVSNHLTEPEGTNRPGGGPDPWRVRGVVHHEQRLHRELARRVEIYDPGSGD